MQSTMENATLQNELVRLQSIIEKLDVAQEVPLRKKLLSKKEAANQLGISYRTIERWYNLGYIERIRIGGRIYFLQEAIFKLAENPEPARKQLAQDIFNRHKAILRR